MKAMKAKDNIKFQKRLLVNMMKSLQKMIDDVQEVFDGNEFRPTEKSLAAALIKLNRRYNKLEPNWYKQYMVITTPKKWLKK